MDIRTFFVTQDREKSTDSVEGATAQESIESVERAPAQESTESVINFVHASHPQPSTAVHAHDLIHVWQSRIEIEHYSIAYRWHCV